MLLRFNNIIVFESEHNKQLNTVKCLYFSILVSNFNNSSVNFIKEGLRMVQQY